METWNVIKHNDPEGDYILINKTNTFIRFSDRVSIDISALLSRMEERNVPISYTEDLAEIYFTHLKDKTYGDYADNKIRLSCCVSTTNELDRTLVHELGHHIDEREDISGRTSIIKEKRTCSKFIDDRYADKNIGEYVAVGFEIYYFGTKEVKAKFKKKNPKLFNVIRYLHRKYRNS